MKNIISLLLAVAIVALAVAGALWLTGRFSFGRIRLLSPRRDASVRSGITNTDANGLSSEERTDLKPGIPRMTVRNVSATASSSAMLCPLNLTSIGYAALE